MHLLISLKKKLSKARTTKVISTFGSRQLNICIDLKNREKIIEH